MNYLKTVNSVREGQNLVSLIHYYQEVIHDLIRSSLSQVVMMTKN